MIKRLFPALVLGAVTLALAAPAAAEEPSKEKWQEVMQIRKRIQEVAGDLQVIQKVVIEQRPDLVKKQKALRAMVAERMKKQGVDEETAMSEVMALRAMLGNKDIPEKKKKEVMDELRTKAMTLKKAHDAATSGPKVKKAQETFRKQMEGAMIKVDPKARKLLEEFYKLRQQMKVLLPPPMPAPADKPKK